MEEVKEVSRHRVRLLTQGRTLCRPPSTYGDPKELPSDPEGLQLFLDASAFPHPAPPWTRMHFEWKPKKITKLGDELWN